MNFKSLSLLKLLFICFAFNACKSSQEYDLRLKLKEGDQFNQLMKNNMNMGMEVMGQKMDMNMIMDAGIQFDVVKMNSNGSEMKMTYTKMNYRMEPGKNSPVPANDSVTEKRMQELVGKSIVLFLNKDNQVDSVHHQYEMKLPENLSEESKAAMKQMFSKEQLNNTFSYMFSMYPDKPVRIGDTWKKELIMNMAGFEMKATANYKLVNVKDNKAEISVKGVIKGDGQLNMVPGLELVMDGTQNGNLFLDMASGYLKDGKYQMDIKATTKKGGMDLKMNMKGNMDISSQ